MSQLKTKCIVLTGKAGSGKSLVGNFILLSGYRMQLVSFATPIKDMLEVLGVPDMYLHVPANKSTPLDAFGGKSARELMQTLGTEWRNMVCKDLWVNHLLDRVQRNKYEYILVDDCRFDHELDALKSNYDVVHIHVTRDGVTKVNEHSSEDGVTHEPDYVIENNGTLAELKEKIQELLEDK